jgi:hypothetical protein
MTSLRSLLTTVSPMFLVASLVGTTGCMQGEGEDGVDDSFLAGGKADAFGVEEASPDAIGVVALVNTGSLEDLDGAAGLSASAAKAIIHHRQGGDRKDGTADDDLIDSLAELDGIPYVGPMTFKLLLDHSRATGLVPSNDPFDPTFCKSDYALTMGMVRGALMEGETVVRLTKNMAGIRVRTRTCVTPDNCPAWVNGAAPKMFTVEGGDAEATLTIPAAGLQAEPQVGIAADGRAVMALFADVAVGDTTPTTAALSIQCLPEALAADDVTPLQFVQCQAYLGDKGLFMLGTAKSVDGSIGGHCMQVRSSVVEGATEREMVYFARY